MKEDSTLVEIDKKLDRLKVERRQNRERDAIAMKEANLVVEDVERLDQEKQLLLEEIKKNERELGVFRKFHGRFRFPFTTSQREKEDLQEIIKTKENELQEAEAKLQEKEKKLEKYKEKIQSLKKKLEEGIRESGVQDGKILQLENEKAKVVADLESERMKVRILVGV